MDEEKHTADCECMSLSFDEELAQTMTAVEVRWMWPRFDGACSCGFMGIAYHSTMHFITGDW